MSPFRIAASPFVFAAALEGVSRTGSSGMHDALHVIALILLVVGLILGYFYLVKRHGMRSDAGIDGTFNGDIDLGG